SVRCGRCARRLRSSSTVGGRIVGGGDAVLCHAKKRLQEGFPRGSWIAQQTAVCHQCLGERCVRAKVCCEGVNDELRRELLRHQGLEKGNKRSLHRLLKLHGIGRH